MGKEMSLKDAIKMVEARIKCEDLDLRHCTDPKVACQGMGSDMCDNCDLCYEQGTVGDRLKALRMVADAAQRYLKGREQAEAFVKANGKGVTARI